MEDSSNWFTEGRVITTTWTDDIGTPPVLALDGIVESVPEVPAVVFPGILIHDHVDD